jgi:hypothetical protein
MLASLLSVIGLILIIVIVVVAIPIGLIVGRVRRRRGNQVP